MRKYIVTLLLLCFYGVSVAGQIKTGPVINVTVDFESARIITGLLAGKKVTDEQLTNAAQAFGSKQLIAKVKGYSGAGEDKFKSTLREIIETGTIKGDDNYNWKLVKANLPQIRLLINKLAADQKSFIADVTRMIETYTPDSINANVRACFLVGGGSLGFVLNDGSIFNVALQKIGNDYEGLRYLVAHELYHSIQDAGRTLRKVSAQKGTPYNAKASWAIAYNVWSEGTATLVGDITRITKPEPFTKVQMEEVNKNLARKRQNFVLIETMLFKAYADTATHVYNELYNIGFTTGYDEAGYYVGYEMAKKLQQFNGAGAIADLIINDPLVMFEEYIKLYKAHPQDNTFIRFDATTEGIIASLAQWKGKI
ncbi:DUF5700 domain-containing putative Zn-dependent protease [Mucilaginibacter terrenus]|nr:DUF5700 domain-containing putative Zn-dependent protease [Mucilaginibacter terrenus]